MTNVTKGRAMAEMVFSQMKSMGFVPYDIEFGNGYFVFNFGQDSVVHFRVKGVSKHWKFGLWLYPENLEKARPAEGEPDYKLNAAQLFVQWDTQIDKFKPSASDICIDFSALSWIRYEENGSDGWLFGQVARMLRTLRRHPFMAYAGVFTGPCTYFDRSYVWHFFKTEWESGSYGIRDQLSRLVWIPYTRMKCAIAKRTRGIQDIEIYDFEKNNPGLLTTYAYEIRITFPEDTTSDQDYNWLKFWFRQNAYGRYRANFDLFRVASSFAKAGREGGRYCFRED